MKIPVFWTISESYAPFTAVSIHSLLKNASREHFYEIYVIHEGLTEGTMEKMSRIVAAHENAAIRFQAMKQSFDAVPKSYLLNMSYFTLTIYFRLFLPDMFPEYDKGIYLDADTVVLGDIAEFFFQDLGDKLMGGVIDPTVVGVKTFADYMAQVVGVDAGHYINSGVLLMNMKGLRMLKFDEHFLRLLSKYEFETIAPDQDYINAILKGRVKYLPHEWNIQPPQGERALAAKMTDVEPKLIHYNLFNKPWHYDDVGLADYFWKEARETEFIAEIEQIARDFSEEDAERDTKSLQAMLDSAERIMKDATRPHFSDVETVRLRDFR